MKTNTLVHEVMSFVFNDMSMNLQVMYSHYHGLNTIVLSCGVFFNLSLMLKISTDKVIP